MDRRDKYPSAVSRRQGGWRLLLAGLLLASTLPVHAQEAQEEPIASTPPPVEVAQARIQGPPGNRHVKAVRELRPGGGRVDWSQQGDWIAFDQANAEGLYDVYRMNVDTGAERCLTCDQWDLRKMHSLSPVWHPSGEYLVFAVQDLPRRMRLDALKLATPHRGLHADLWVITRNGKEMWQLTRVSQNGGAVVDPHFSHEAGHLLWTERVESRVGRWGAWVQRVSEFRIKRGLPRLGKVQTYEPPISKGFVLAHGFTPNDRGLLLSAGEHESGRDILRFDLDGGRLEPLTKTPEHRDELVSVAPRGDRLVWVSDRNIPRRAGQRLPWRGDLWFRTESDGIQQRLTFFNDPRSEHALGETLIDDVAWSPLGDRLAVHVVWVAEDELAVDEGPPVKEAIYVVELDDSFAR